jgi:predicted enzyme related to lactoylglutathione lyase
VELEPYSPYSFTPFEQSLIPKISTAKVAPENHLTPAKHPDNVAKEKKTINVAITVESIEDSLAAIEKNGGAVYQ